MLFFVLAVGIQAKLKVAVAGRNTRGDTLLDASVYRFFSVHPYTLVIDFETRGVNTFPYTNVTKRAAAKKKL
ncbi:MAG: hypothetical protein ACXW1F_04315, partial [Halobacteriota archaeon]